MRQGPGARSIRREPARALTGAAAGWLMLAAAAAFAGGALAPDGAALAGGVLPGVAPAPGAAAAGGVSAPADTALTAAETEWFLVPAGTAQLALAHAFVEPGTLRAEVGGLPWQAGTDFVVAEREGIWLPQRALGGEGAGPVLVRLDYRFRPAPLPARRDLHPVVSGAPAGGAAAAGPGSLAAGGAGGEGAPGAAGAGGGGEAGAAAAGTLPGGGAGAAVAGSGALEIRGSKSVRLARGTNRELAVDQTLRLSIEGQLTPEITVRAALSDDNLPVVPEGTTEELRDIDRVLVELEAARWRSTLGDFEAAREGSDFGDYRRKLQGLSLSARPGPARAELLAGSPRGAYRTVQIRGEEANQGPYRLGAGGMARDLFLVAGSERVTLDGERLTRGADRDYVIDYVRGTITFTYRRLITAESTIVVEFEEGEGAYARTVAGGGAGADFTLPLGGGLPGALLMRLTRERDDPQRLRSGELGGDDQAVLAAAGDDAALAVADGVALAPDGGGSYRREDVAGQPVYVYDPAGGPYDLTFYYAGPGGGDYGVDSLTVAGTRVFGWRGPGNGSYRLGRPLPLPQSQSLATLAARLGPADRPRLRLEWDASRTDRNVLSGRDDGDNAGVGWTAHAATGEGALRPAGLDLGRISLAFDHENRDSRFRPFQLRKDRFQYDRWGLAGRAQRDGFLEERDVESRLAGRWAGGAERRRWDLTGEWGRLSHGAGLAARRWSAQGAWRWDDWDGVSRWDEARSEDGRDPLDARRARQRHEAGWSTRWLRPSVRWEREEWRDAAREAGAAAAGARRESWGGRLEAAPGRAFRWLVGWERTLADSLRTRAWARERDGRTATLQLAPPAWGGLRLTADGAWRGVRGAGGEQSARLAKVALAGAWPRLGSDWSLQYGIDNSRTEVLDRQVVFVGERQGDYDQGGGFVGRNLGDFNVIYAGTDSLVATTEVTGDLTWRQGLAWLGGPAAAGRWSLLTQAAARGRSRAADVGPLLRLAPDALFDPAQTVLGEVTLRQELSALALARGTDLRLRFEYDEALDRQYVSHPEDRLRRLHQATTTHSLGERTSLQLRAQRQQERRATRAGGLGVDRGYRVDSWLGEAEGSWRPGAGNRVALAAEARERRDGVSGIRQREWGLRPSARLLLDRRWSLQLDLRWAQVASEGPVGAQRPYFFPYPGANREAGLRLAWEPSPQLSVSGVYFGRRQGERGWQHDVRVESTARF